MSNQGDTTPEQPAPQDATGSPNPAPPIPPGPVRLTEAEAAALRKQMSEASEWAKKELDKPSLPRPDPLPKAPPKAFYEKSADFGKPSEELNRQAREQVKAGRAQYLRTLRGPKSEEG